MVPSQYILNVDIDLYYNLYLESILPYTHQVVVCVWGGVGGLSGYGGRVACACVCVCVSVCVIIVIIVMFMVDFI